MDTDRCNNTEKSPRIRGKQVLTQRVARFFYVVRLYLRISGFICGSTAFYGIISFTMEYYLKI